MLQAERKQLIHRGLVPFEPATMSSGEGGFGIARPVVRPSITHVHSNVTAMRNGAAVVVIFETKSKLTISWSGRGLSQAA
jgi:hypothetical protein